MSKTIPEHEAPSHRRRSLAGPMEVKCGHDTYGPNFCTGLPVVKVKPDAKNPRGLVGTMVYPRTAESVREGRYVLWPVGELGRLIRYLQNLSSWNER